jgi:hypothetical protein
MHSPSPLYHQEEQVFRDIIVTSECSTAIPHSRTDFKYCSVPISMPVDDRGLRERVTCASVFLRFWRVMICWWLLVVGRGRCLGGICGRKSQYAGRKDGEFI